MVASARDAVAAARSGEPDGLPPGRPELGRAGRRPDEPPLLRVLRPAPDPAPDRGGARRRRPLRDPGRGVPVLPAGPGRDADARAARVGGHGQRGVRAVGVAVGVRAVDRAPPPRGGLRTRDGAGHPGDRGGAPERPRDARPDARRAAVQPDPAHGAAARARGRDLSLALGDPPAAAGHRRPGARDRAAGQPGLPGGGGGGAARARRWGRGVAGLIPARHIDGVAPRPSARWRADPWAVRPTPVTEGSRCSAAASRVAWQSRTARSSARPAARS